MYMTAPRASRTVPGRLGDPTCTMGTDPRIDPRLVEAFEPLGLTGEPPDVGLRFGTSTTADIVGFCDAAEPGYEQLFEAMPKPTRPVEIDVSELTIKGGDGQDLTLIVYKPAGTEGKLDCVYYTHGGGMAFLTAKAAYITEWCKSIAAKGVCCIAVDFRNIGGKNGPHPFPAGLNDCYAGLEHIATNKEDLGINKILITGESGGGNLSIATTMKQCAAGKTYVDALFTMCPYIAGPKNYSTKPPHIPSLTENDGIWLDVGMMACLASAYLQNGEKEEETPLAWPIYAKAEDLKGFPPTIVSVNECDPLRDEGLVFYRTLRTAGVTCSARTVHGTW